MVAGKWASKVTVKSCCFSRGVWKLKYKMPRLPPFLLQVSAATINKYLFFNFHFLTSPPGERVPGNFS